MSKLTTAILVIVLIFFIVGFIAGDYHCTVHFCNMMLSGVQFITEVVKTEAKGITIVFSTITGIIA